MLSWRNDDRIQYVEMRELDLWKKPTVFFGKDFFHITKYYIHQNTISVLSGY